MYGKTPIGVAKTAKKYNIPVIGIAGSLGDDCGIVYEHGMDALFSIVPGVIALEDAMAHATYYTEKQAENIARMIRLSGQYKIYQDPAWLEASSGGCFLWHSIGKTGFPIENPELSIVKV